MSIITFSVNAVSTTDPSIVLPINTSLSHYKIRRVGAYSHGSAGMNWRMFFQNVRFDGATTSVTVSNAGVLSTQAMDFRTEDYYEFPCPANALTTISANASAAATITLMVWYDISAKTAGMTGT